MKRYVFIIALLSLSVVPIFAQYTPCYTCRSLPCEGEGCGGHHSNQVECAMVYWPAVHGSGRTGCEERNVEVGPSYCLMYDSACAGMMPPPVLPSRTVGSTAATTVHSVTPDAMSIETLNSNTIDLEQFLDKSGLITRLDLIDFMSGVEREAAKLDHAQATMYRYVTVLSKVSSVTGRTLTFGDMLVIPQAPRGERPVRSDPN